MAVVAIAALAWGHLQQVQAARLQALAHTRVYTEGQPEMSIQVYDIPGHPSIGALAPFTKVSVQCVVTANQKQYALVSVDLASVYFSGGRLYVRLENVEHRDGAPGC